MSKSGFVYILGNEYMPDLYKIGCTERSPRARADELSNHTGVPAPFSVLCYAEFDDFQAIERNMHEWCKDYRVNTGREFFADCLVYAVSLLWYHPSRLAFTDATAGSGWPMHSELTVMVCKEAHESYLDDLRNPFAVKEEEDARIAKLKKHASGDFAAEIPGVVPQLDGSRSEGAEPLLHVVGGTDA